VTVTLNDWTDNGSQPAGQDREFILQAPSGQTFQFIGHVTSDVGFSNMTYTLDDSAASVIPTNNFNPAPASGTYKPNVNTPAVYCQNWPASPTFNPSSSPPTYNGGTNTNCAQSGTHPTFASVFNGLSPFGTWTVWEFTAPVQGDSAATVASWTLAITPAVAAGTTTSISSSSTNSESFFGDSVTFTATVTSSGNPVTDGSVTFIDSVGNTTLGTVALNSSGVAALPYTFMSSGQTNSFEGNHVISANYNGTSNFAPSSSSLTQFVDNHTVVNGTQFCNPGTINLNTMNGQAQPGVPYPQHVFVTGLGGSITGLSLALNNVNAFPSPLEVLLVGPGGDKFVALAGAGGNSNKLSGANLILSDAAANLVPASGLSGGGTFLPTDYIANIAFPAPAPAGPYQLPGTQGSATFVGTFANEPVNNPNNDKWSLYVFYNFPGDTGSIGGYCLTFATNNVAPTSTNLNASPSPGVTGAPVTFTATVTSNGSPVTQGSVTFLEGGSKIAGPTNLDSNGQAIFTTSSLSEGIHNITASYSGVAGSFNVSSATISEEIDTPTTNPSPGVYCNPGGLTIPSSGSNSASPYPSRINVTNLGGTVRSVKVMLDDFTHDDPVETLMLVTGPTATNLVFWDDAGGSTPITSPLDIIFDDAASSQLPATVPVTSGTFKPTAYNNLPTIIFPAPAPTDPSYAAPLGVETLTTAFQGINPNGFWSLFMFNRPGSFPASVGNWCLSFTQNAPVLAITKSHTGSFTQGDTADTYTIKVSNDGPGSTGGTVTVTDTLPTGLTATAIAGNNWNCTLGTLTCTRSDALAPVNSYDTITLTVKVGFDAPTGTNSVTNSVAVSGGGSTGTTTTLDPTTINPGQVQVTFSTNPAGLSFSVDGTTYTSMQTLALVNGTQHTIATTSPQTSGGTRNTFASWSDGGAISHMITIAGSAAGTASYTASFETSYQLTTSANPSNGGTVAPSSGTFFPSGTIVNLTATPNPGFKFVNWTGSVANANNASTTITMNAPQSVTANFAMGAVNVTPSVSVSSSGLAYNRIKHIGSETFTLRNISSQPITGPIQVVLSLTTGATAVNNTGTFQSNPFWTVPGVATLAPGASATVTIQLSYSPGTSVTTTPTIYSGSF